MTGTFSSGETIDDLEHQLQPEARLRAARPAHPSLTRSQDHRTNPAPASPLRDALFITNVIEGWSAEPTGDLDARARSGRPGRDRRQRHRRMPGRSDANCNSLIVSSIADPATGNVISWPWTPDRRQVSGTSTCSSASNPLRPAGPVRLAHRQQAGLRLPDGGRKTPFAGKPLTFQQYDPVDPNAAYPVWDIRKIIANNQGVLPLGGPAGFRRQRHPLPVRPPFDEPPARRRPAGRPDRRQRLHLIAWQQGSHRSDRHGRREPQGPGPARRRRGRLGPALPVRVAHRRGEGQGDAAGAAGPDGRLRVRAISAR